MTNDLAEDLVAGAEVETWSGATDIAHPTAKGSATKRPGIASAVEGSTSSASRPRTPSVAPDLSAEWQAQARAWEARCRAAEDHGQAMNMTVTRVVECTTRSAAAIKTAARFARQAADCFDAEHHNVQAALEGIQQMYSTAEQPPPPEASPLYRLTM